MAVRAGPGSPQHQPPSMGGERQAVPEVGAVLQAVAGRGRRAGLRPGSAEPADGRASRRPRPVGRVRGVPRGGRGRIGRPGDETAGRSHTAHSLEILGCVTPVLGASLAVGAEVVHGGGAPGVWAPKETSKVGFAVLAGIVRLVPRAICALQAARTPSNTSRVAARQRLLAGGEHVLDVPAKLSARGRLFDTGHNRKTDAHDAHVVAVVAVRTTGLRVLSYDEQLEALRLLADRRDELSQTRFKRSTGSIVFWRNSFRDSRSGTSRPARLGPSWPRSGLGIWPARSVVGSPRSSWQSSSRSRRRSRSSPRSSRRCHRQRLHADEPARRRAGRRRRNLGRHRRRSARFTDRNRFGVLDRHRPDRGLLRRGRPAPAVEGREPADEPHDPHRRRHSDPPLTPRAGRTTDASSLLASPGGKRCAA